MATVPGPVSVGPSEINRDFGTSADADEADADDDEEEDEDDDDDGGCLHSVIPYLRALLSRISDAFVWGGDAGLLNHGVPAGP